MRGTAFGRVNLIGEHTDYNDGLVLPMSIGLGVTVTATPRADRMVHAKSVMLDATESYELGREAKRGRWIDFVMGSTWALAMAGTTFEHGFDLLVESTLPAGAGLASSAALTSAVVRALHDSILPKDLAVLTHTAETRFVETPIGMMDNIVCAWGTPGHAMLVDCESNEMRPIEMPADVTIVVVDSGVSHENASSGYAVRRAECEQASARLGVKSLRHATSSTHLTAALARRVRHVTTENERVRKTVAALAAGDVLEVGRLFDASHASMRDDYEVSVPEVDRLVEALRTQEGVYGARMTGGGFGGCVIALVKKGSEAAAERAAATCPGARSVPLR